MGIAISIPGFHCPLKRKPRAMTNEIAAVAITKYGALSFPEKWHNKIVAKKTEFVRITVDFTSSVLSKVTRLTRKEIPLDGYLSKIVKFSYLSQVLF